MSLVINADDFGVSHEVNLAVDYCIRNNYIDRASLMMNMPFTREAVYLARTGNYLNRIGLHLNLTEGIPLTKSVLETSLCDQGKFCRLFLNNKYSKIYLNRNERILVQKEIHAQFELFREMNPYGTNLDSHHHVHTFISVTNLWKPAFEEYNFTTARLSRNIPLEKLKGLTGVYKRYINNTIFGICNDKLNQTLYFGDITDYPYIISKGLAESKIELEVHPVYRNNHLVDKDELLEDVLRRAQYYRVKQV